MSTSTLTANWHYLKRVYGAEAASLSIVSYFKDHGVVFPPSWDDQQCQQLVMAFMESVKVINGMVNYSVDIKGATTEQEVEEVFNALACSRSVVIPEHMLVFPLTKLTYTQQRKLGKRR